MLKCLSKVEQKSILIQNWCRHKYKCATVLQKQCNESVVIHLAVLPDYLQLCEPMNSQSVFLGRSGPHQQ